MSFTKITRCSEGAVAVISAIVFPLLLGFTSLGVEVGHWYLAQRQMQGAADAAAVSAAAQYIADYPTNPGSTAYQTVGQSYAALNGFTIPLANVCLITADSDNCDPVRSLDTRPIVCPSPPCLVVEITQDTATWVTTLASLMPTDTAGHVQTIPTPVLAARSVVSGQIGTQTVTTSGGDCVLALANAPDAVTISGGGKLRAPCGIAIDGGLTQNVGTPVVSGITFNGDNSKIQVASLVLASGDTTTCPATDDGAHCERYCTEIECPELDTVTRNEPTPDPYAAEVAAMFQTPPPQGVRSATVGGGGGGYTDGTHLFTEAGGAQILASVTNGTVTAVLGVFDPGAYAALPTSPVWTADDGSGSGVQFTLTQGCFTFPGIAVAGKTWTPIPGRKYCSIFANGQQRILFPAGTYWIAGGDANCVGLCISGNNASMASDAAGTTFLLTNGEGSGDFGLAAYAQVAIRSGTVSLCAPGTNCGQTCVQGGSCYLIVQNPAAPPSTGPKVPTNTDNIFNGNGLNTLSGLVYLPNQTFDNNGGAAILGCFGVVAKYVVIAGTPIFQNGCLPGDGIGGGTTTVTTLTNPRLSQ